jgi:hypothetical protein
MVVRIAMDDLTRRLWQAELNRVVTQRMEFLKHMPPAEPIPWWRGQWNLLQWRISEVREWLGEKIAGRRFEDY